MTPALRAAPRPRLQPATPAHAAVLAALHAVCFRDQPWHRPWRPDEMADVLALPGVRGWLALAPDPPPADGDTEATDMDTPVGLLLVQAVGFDADILTLGVLPGGWRRHGLARALVQEGEKTLDVAGVERVHLEVAERNIAAQTFYARLGYSQVGRRPRYYHDENGVSQDAITMCRSLSQSHPAANEPRP
ncbi:GNAT family N-acetyltransferase [Roseospira navarrensis]|uniref:GNAT family N-acetyltransferase n=1 Tax=Roseospira navarrensis TaxID=140058 RepID=A0A7X2D5G7_9PROT|nr:GNAT family N-acetyltransferase [Roseospira navarrensis]MQX37195.1 GNAT family N-acetyltransferase [Roseospira navarrensis]